MFNVIKKYKTAFLLASVAGIFTFSFVKGSSLVKKSEKELNTKEQKSEAKAEGYSLKEIDAKTGTIRWQLTAEEGSTENNLQGASIKGINAEVYKDNKVVFELSAPSAKGNYGSKEIYLLGKVIAKNPLGTFLLTTNQLALGMGTSIEAQKGFSLILKNSGSVIGENAIVNDDQTKIIVENLKEAIFKNLTLSGTKVSIEKDSGDSDLKNAIITEGGKIVIKDELRNDVLTANEIRWKKDGDVEAISNVVFTSNDKTFRAGYLLLKPDGKVIAKNNVLIVHGNTKCSGNQLNYENDFITVSGKPKAIQGSNQITADKIVYNLQTGKVEASGNVKTATVKVATVNKA
jgi:LPS export ABC transporter protein LptC